MDIYLLALRFGHSVIARHRLWIVAQKQSYQAPNYGKYNSTKKHPYKIIDNKLLQKLQMLCVSIGINILRVRRAIYANA